MMRGVLQTSLSCVCTVEGGPTLCVLSKSTAAPQILGVLVYILHVLNIETFTSDGLHF